MENQNLKSFSKLSLSCILPLNLLSCSSLFLPEEVKGHVFQWTVTVCLVRGEFMPLYSISDKQCKPKASLKVQEAESHVPHQSYQRHQKPPPTCSKGICRCPWEPRRLRVVETRVSVSGLRGRFQPFAPLSFLSVANPTKSCKWFSMCWWSVSSLQLQCQFCPQKQSDLSAELCWEYLNLEYGEYKQPGSAYCDISPLRQNTCLHGLHL